MDTDLFISKTSELDNALVSVVMVTYKHEQYLKEAIDGVLSQSTDFPIELIIADDHSPDSTEAIIEEYLQQKYPLKQIIYIKQSRNVGPYENWLSAIRVSRGTYIAFCEGDDYWIDTRKLQKQVSALQSQPEYCLCFSNYKTKNELTGIETISQLHGEFIIEQLISANQMATATSVFDAKYLKPIPESAKDIPFGDWAMYLLALHRSGLKAVCLNDITAVYRIHPGGIHGRLHDTNASLANAYQQHIYFYKLIRQYFLGDEYAKEIKEAMEVREQYIQNLLDIKKTPDFCIKQIKSIAAKNQKLLLVDEGKWDLYGVHDDRTIIPFPEQNGLYWGLPDGDSSAIKEIERQRENGVDFIMFPWFSFWWFDYYKGMKKHLEENFRGVQNNDYFKVFSLGPLRAVE